MTQENSDYAISTYARVVLSNWQALAKLFVVRSTEIKDLANPFSAPAADEPLDILSDEQIAAVLAGPYAPFFRLKMAAYARIAQLKMELTIKEDELWQAANHESKVSAGQLEATSTAELDTKLKQLSEQLDQHYQQWQHQMGIWQQDILMKLNMLDVGLSDLEIKEFKDEETLPELLARFTELSLDKPKMKSDQINFEAFFRLKATLLIHSSLSREHKPHATEDIQKILKQLKSELTNIAKLEKQLLAHQQQETLNG